MSIQRAKLLIERKVQLPTLPHVVTRITALANDPNTSAEEMGELIGQDAPIAAKVLRIANSSYYSVQEEVVSTDRAAAVLGFDLLKSIVTQASVIAQFKHLSENEALDLESVWHHSILTGQVSAHLARRCRHRLGLMPNEFHVIGLLHDIGKVLLLDGMGAEYAEVLARASASRRPLIVLEREVLGFGHTDVGALLAASWSLPAPFVRAIQFHHGPREAVASDPVVCLVANVNLIVDHLDESNLDPLEVAATFDEAARELLGVDDARIAESIAFGVETAATLEI